MLGGLRQLFQSPLIFVHIIAQGDLGVHIVTKEVDVGLGVLILGQRRKLE
jgi:hypothetical protein